MLIASSRNPYCRAERIQLILNAVKDSAGVDVDMCVTDIEAHVRFPGHTFVRSDGTKTVPDKEIVLALKGAT